MGKRSIKTRSVKRKTVTRRYGPSSKGRVVRKRSAKPAVAGTFLIIIGILGILVSLGIGAAAVMFYSVDEDYRFESWGNVQCSLIGQVTDVDGNPVEGALIELIDYDIETLTDTNGYYSVMNLDMGFLEIRVSTDGYVTQKFSIFMNDNDNINLSEYEERKELWLDGDGVTGWDDNYDDDYYDDEHYGDKHKDVKDFESDNNYHLIRLNAGEGYDAKDSLNYHSFFQGLGLFTCMCFGVVFLSSLITLGGGILAVMRKGYGIAILGCVTGLLTLTFPLNMIFCVAAFFILLLSYDEFFPKRRRKSRYRPVEKTVTYEKD